MKDQELLFLAIGAADSELVARSERRRRSRWPGYCLAAAACLALIVSLGHVLPSRTEPDIHRPPAVTKPEPPEDHASSPEDGLDLLPEEGGETGALRLLSYTPQSQEESVDFLIYVNEEQFSIREEDGLYSISNNNPLPENFPECSLEIFHLSRLLPEEAEKAAAEALKERYKEIFSEEESAVLSKSPYLRASAGADWDSEQAELWFVDDGQGGTFVLTARYFLEAEEGMGMRFRDMAASFRVVSLNKTVPEWMRSLYETVDRLFPALLSNDLSGVSDLLAEDAEAGAYGEDVWEYLTVSSVDYAPDDSRNPASATVWVKHRLNLEEGESDQFLTMELIRRDGRWLLTWSGIEK